MNEIKIGYQGIEGSNSAQVAHDFSRIMSNEETIFVPLISSEEVIRSLADGSIDYGVVATRNSIGGIVEETREAMKNIRCEIIFTKILEIRHNLYKLRTAELHEINTIASHIQALRQTKQNRAIMFQSCGELELPDTAIGALWLAEGALPPNIAVLCSAAAGRIYDLDLIVEHMEDRLDNRTEFAVLRAIRREPT